ncbi:MAG: hypothetical protein MZV65_53575 [Chromatiales bacterium]|nr:hypothetical protein [Chromatiales bacterium]
MRYSITRCCSSRRRSPRPLAYELRNLLRLERWLRRRAVEPAPNMHGLWGEVARDRQSPLPPQGVPQAARAGAAARVPAHDLGDARRRDPARAASRDPLVQPHRRALARPEAARSTTACGSTTWCATRISSSTSNRRGASVPPRIHLPKHGDRWLLFRLVTTNATGPAAADPARRDERGAARVACARTSSRTPRMNCARRSP